MTAPIRIAVVGLGKIAHDQHLPAIAGSADFRLVAGASLHGEAPGVPTYRSVEALLAAAPKLDAVALCQPPQARFTAAAAAIRAGKHVLLEKPPGATLGEVEALVGLAATAGVTLFAAWHSRFAPGVAAARAWLAARRIERVEVVWKEDVRRWHPGQQWIWEPGGLGVFDPGINALSILTEILPGAVFLTDGVLEVPANHAAPIAADLRLAGAGGAPVTAAFDWRQEGPQTWDIAVETDDGMLRLSQGGARLEVDGVARALAAKAEYPELYARFARLIADRASDVDVAPLRLTADAFLRCRQVTVAAFEE